MVAGEKDGKSLKAYQIALMAAIVVLLLFADFAFFHDYFKPGETTSVAQYQAGAASLLVFSLFGSFAAKSGR